MIKSLFLLVSTHLMCVPMLVGSVPLMLRRAIRISYVGGRYLPKQSNKWGFRRNLLPQLKPFSGSHVKLPILYPEKWKDSRIQREPIEPKNKKRRYQRRTYSQWGSWGVYVPGCLCVASIFLEKKQNGDQGQNPIKREELFAEIEKKMHSAHILMDNVVITGQNEEEKRLFLRDFIVSVLDKFPVILWFNAEDEEAFCNNLRCLAEGMGLEDAKSKPIWEVKTFIEMYPGKEEEVLIIYYNLDKNNFTRKLYFPNRRVIITSKEDWTLAYNVKVTSLTAEEIELLLTEQKLPGISDEVLKKLPKLLVGESILTIRLLVYCLKKYQPEYEKLCELLSKKDDVASAIHELYLEKLKEEDSRLLQTLGMLCYVEPSAITYEFLADLLGKDAITELVNAGVLSDHTPVSYWRLYDDKKSSKKSQNKHCLRDPKLPKLGVYSMHMPKSYVINKGLQKSIKACTDPIQVLKERIDFLVPRWNYCYEDPSTWKKVEQQRCHINSLWKHVKESQNRGMIVKMIPIISSLAKYNLDVQYHLEEAENLLKEVLRCGVAPDEGESVKNSIIADIYWSLGRVKMEQYELAAAIDYLEKALTYATSELQAAIYSSLANIYVKKGDWSLYQENIEKAMEAPNRSNLINAEIYRVKAIYHYRRSELDTASVCIKNALQFLGGKNDPCKVSIYRAKFTINFLLEDHDLACNVLKKWKNMMDKYFPHHPKWSSSYYYSDALVLSLMGLHASAISELTKSLSIGERVWGFDHPDNMLYRINIARAHIRLRKSKEALIRLNSVLTSSIQTNNREMQAWVYLELAKLEMAVQCYELSLVYTETALKTMKNTLLRNTPFFGYAKYLLGVNYKALRKKELAKEKLEEALCIYKKHFKEDHKMIKDIKELLNELGDQIAFREL